MKIKNIKQIVLQKRFAAKEAFSKALGTGISKGINFNEIKIVQNIKSGKPIIKLINNTKKIVIKKIKKKEYKYFYLYLMINHLL